MKDCRSLVNSMALSTCLAALILSNHRAPGAPPQRDASAVAQTRPTTAPARTETIRIADPNELEVTLMTQANPSDHFPHATVKVYNAASEDVIVGYEPACVVVHCGPYEQHGPGMTFTQRREILRPRQPLEFDLPPGGWMRSPTKGEQDLMLPVELPTGKYSVWATFKLCDSTQFVESPHDVYVLR